MNTQSLVSIIIPTYNRAHLIGETLDSVVAQTYLNWECIIVDDGSSDTTDEVVGEYTKKDTRFKYYHRPEEHLSGGNGARNFGYEMSKGKYIQWFDSDDLMHPQKIKLKIENAVLYQAQVIIDSHTENSNYINTEKYDVDCFTSSDFYIDFILGKKPVITNDVMLKRQIIGDFRFDENLRKAQEFEFLSRLFHQNLNYCFLDLKLSFYKPSSNSISKSSKKKQAVHLIYLCKKIIKSHQDPKIQERMYRQVRKTYKHMALERELMFIFKNYHFFKNAFKKNHLAFLVYVCYNLLTGKGFDVMKPKK
jgi:glycosyltransferase involved in cell wall biosynthesis